VKRVLPFLAFLCASPAGAQSPLTLAAERARDAWLAHRPEALLARSPGVILQIPGSDPSSAIGRDQAGALLARYLRTAAERSVEVTAVREVEEGRGYVELVRRFQIVGTSEERHQTVYLGFRRVGETWVVVELRLAQ
jgi:hypothetical protein